MNVITVAVMKSHANFLYSKLAAIIPMIKITHAIIISEFWIADSGLVLLSLTFDAEFSSFLLKSRKIDIIFDIGKSTQNTDRPMLSAIFSMPPLKQ